MNTTWNTAEGSLELYQDGPASYTVEGTLELYQDGPASYTVEATLELYQGGPASFPSASRRGCRGQRVPTIPQC